MGVRDSGFGSRGSGFGSRGSPLRGPHPLGNAVSRERLPWLPVSFEGCGASFRYGRIGRATRQSTLARHTVIACKATGTFPLPTANPGPRRCGTGTTLLSPCHVPPRCLPARKPSLAATGYSARTSLVRGTRPSTDMRPRRRPFPVARHPSPDNCELPSASSPIPRPASRLPTPRPARAVFPVGSGRTRRGVAAGSRPQRYPRKTARRLRRRTVSNWLPLRRG